MRKIKISGWDLRDCCGSKSNDKSPYERQKRGDPEERPCEPGGRDGAMHVEVQEDSRRGVRH